MRFSVKGTGGFLAERGSGFAFDAMLVTNDS